VICIWASVAAGKLNRRPVHYRLYITGVSADPPASPKPSVQPSNAVTEAILSRRSARDQFASRPVPEDVLAEIVGCALAAPSAKNAQPWRFHVVSDRALLAELADAMERSPGLDSYVPMDPLTGKPRPDIPSTVLLSASILRQAAIGIFVENRSPFGRSRQSIVEAIQSGRIGSLIGYSFEVLGIGAAIENMWVAAESFGLRGCYLGDVVIAEDEVRRRLGMQDDLIGVLALGYSDEPIRPRLLADALSDPTHVVWHSVPGLDPLSPRLEKDS
jgi:nitroreductase